MTLTTAKKRLNRWRKEGVVRFDWRTRQDFTLLKEAFGLQNIEDFWRENLVSELEALRTQKEQAAREKEQAAKEKEWAAADDLQVFHGSRREVEFLAAVDFGGVAGHSPRPGRGDHGQTPRLADGYIQP